MLKLSYILLERFEEPLVYLLIEFSHSETYNIPIGEQYYRETVVEGSCSTSGVSKTYAFGTITILNTGVGWVKIKDTKFKVEFIEPRSVELAVKDKCKGNSVVGGDFRVNKVILPERLEVPVSLDFVKDTIRQVLKEGEKAKEVTIEDTQNIVYKLPKNDWIFEVALFIRDNEIINSNFYAKKKSVIVRYIGNIADIVREI
jgi:hypothetical protein